MLITTGKYDVTSSDLNYDSGFFQRFRFTTFYTTVQNLQILLFVPARRKSSSHVYVTRLTTVHTVPTSAGELTSFHHIIHTTSQAAHSAHILKKFTFVLFTPKLRARCGQCGQSHIKISRYVLPDHRFATWSTIAQWMAQILRHRLIPKQRHKQGRVKKKICGKIAKSYGPQLPTK